MHPYEEAPRPGNSGPCLKHRKDSREVLLKGLSRAVPRPALCFERSLLASWTLVWGEGEVGKAGTEGPLSPGGRALSHWNARGWGMLA